MWSKADMDRFLINEGEVDFTSLFYSFPES